MSYGFVVVVECMLSILSAPLLMSSQLAIELGYILSMPSSELSIALDCFFDVECLLSVLSSVISKPLRLLADAWNRTL